MPVPQMFEERQDNFKYFPLNLRSTAIKYGLVTKCDFLDNPDPGEPRKAEQMCEASVGGVVENFSEWN
jgi:hypothetical protein